MKSKYIIACLVSLLHYQIAVAQIPKTISYQGVLTNADGTTVADGETNLTFRLYDVADDGQFLWEETQTVETENGLFNVILGSQTPLDLPFDEQYWLGITVGEESEMTPRTPLTASPYSLNSQVNFVEPEAGQGLTIRDENGEVTHEFSADGDATHIGIGTFRGGIIAGDSVTVDSTDIEDLFEKPGKVTLNQNDELPSYGLSAKGSTVGVAGAGSYTGIFGKGRFGVLGEGHTGVRGNGDEAGIVGVTENGLFGVLGRGDIGVSGIGRIGVQGAGEIGVNAVGQLRVTDVPDAPEQERFLVWDTDNLVKYRNLPPGSGSGLDCATCEDGALEAELISITTPSGWVIVGKKEDPGESVFKIDVPNQETQTPAMEVTHNGSGSGITADIKNPNYNEIFSRVGVDQSIANLNMNGIVGLFNSKGTSMQAIQANATKRAIVAINNSSEDATGTFNNNSASGVSISANANVEVGGEITTGNASSKIDHPLDPANKYLNHAYIESSERMNVYNGNVTLNGAGEATVQLPDWFGALNENFRYQLTCIGGFAQVYIAEEIQDNRFKIAGGSVGLKVSWQITGVRKDAFAKANPLNVEEQKPQKEIGRYRHPEALGRSKAEGVFYEEQQ